jgi:hypothetical protein
MATVEAEVEMKKVGTLAAIWRTAVLESCWTHGGLCTSAK